MKERLLDKEFGPIEVVSSPCMKPGTFAMLSAGLVYMMGADTIYRFSGDLDGSRKQRTLRRMAVALPRTTRRFCRRIQT